MGHQTAVQTAAAMVVMKDYKKAVRRDRHLVV